MATTTLAATLTETHRRAQLALRAAVLAALVRMWPTFDPADLAGSWDTLEPALLALIAAGGNTSAGLAAAYYDAFRRAERIAGPAVTPVLAAAAPVDEVVRSLRFVGVVGTQKLLDAGRADAADVAFTNVSGEMTRQVLNQGRDTLIDTVSADPKAIGWARVASGGGCAFCLMLVSRGPVYSEHGGDFAAHSHCGCSLEPVYSRDQPWPGRARELHAQWNEVTDGLGGADARLAFRQHVEGRSN